MSIDHWHHTFFEQKLHASTKRARSRVAARTRVFRTILELWRTGYVLVNIDEHAVTLGARRR
jgi:hypothetical protein